MILNGKYRAEYYHGLLKKAYELWQWNESGSLDGYAFMALFEPLLKVIRPEVKVKPVQTKSWRPGFPPDNDPARRVFRSLIDIEVDRYGAKIKVWAARQGNRPGKTMPIWQVRRVTKERSYYGPEMLSPIVPFSQELTMQEAIELARRIAFDEA
jgi:hypothetical protein